MEIEVYENTNADIILSLIIAILWGLFPFVIKYASQESSVNIVLLVMSFVWFASSCVYNLVLYKGNLFRHLSDIKETLFIIIVLAGFIGLFIKNLLYLYVIDTTKRLNVSISIMSLSSVVSLLYGLYIMKYDINIGTIIGISLTAIGVSLMIYSSTK